MTFRRAIRLLTPLADFLRTEASGGALLLAATVVALVWANSAWAATYTELWHTELAIGVEPLRLSLDLQHWINDALMALFFFLVGLEIKRELVCGELRDIRAAALPALAAVGGMVVPALLFVLVASDVGDGGWGIPMATDIAFAVGVLTVLGTRAPAGLKLFLLTLAIVDDIGAITVIAIFYSAGVSLPWLAGAAAALVAVVAARRLGVSHPLAYVPLGVAAWVATLQAGIHPTIAGVALGLLTPAQPVAGRNVLHDLEHGIHPWTSYLIVPLFALANAGVPLGGDALRAAAGSRLTWAVVVGLVVGKAAGVTAATLLGRRLGAGRLPAGVRPRHVLGAGGLAGIGFTVALFIASLAFPDAALQAEAKIGILAASAAAAAVGVVVLLSAPRPARTPQRVQETVGS